MRSIYFKITLLNALLLFCTSCTNQILKDFEISNYEYNETFLKIYFTSEINKYKFIESFNFFEDEILQDGTYLFEQNCVSYFPINKITKNHLYKFSISKNCEDTKGNSILENYSKTFSTKECDIMPEIKNFIMSDNHIEIYFNSPIETNSFKNSFNISPAIKYIEEWNIDNNHVKITFLENKKNNTYYFFKINTNLKNVYNNFLKTDFEYTDNYNIDNSETTYKVFSITDETSNQLSNTIINDNIKFDTNFKIIFSKELNPENYSAEINFTPTLDFEIETPTYEKKSLIIKLKEKPKFNTNYKLSISENILDKNYNKISENTFLLNFNNENNKPVEYINGFILIGNQIIELTESSNFSDITFPVNIFPTANIEHPNQNIYFIFAFKISEYSKKINQISFMENFKIAQTNNCIQIEPIKIESLSKEEFNVNTDPLYKNIQFNLNNQTNYSFIQVEATVKNHDKNGLIKISIPENIVDNKDNKLKKTISFTFNKN